VKFSEVVDLFHDILEDRTGERIKQRFSNEYSAKLGSSEKFYIIIQECKDFCNMSYTIKFPHTNILISDKKEITSSYVENIIDFMLKESL